MHISHAALISTLTFAPLTLFGQANPAPPHLPLRRPSSNASSVLQPALTEVESTLTSLKIDKWKKGSVRDEAGANVNAMLGDLKTNLPPLISDADASHGAVSKSIPLMKHLDALYDVLLRVEEGSRVSGPADQVDQLEQALKKFEIARITLYDNLQQNAAGQEKQVTDLQASIKAHEEAAAKEQAKAAPAPAPCTPPKPAVKKKRPAPKPATPAPAGNTQAPPTPPKTQ